MIGVSHFANLPKDDWLEFAHADAQDFAKLIKSPRGRGFPEENIKIFSNETAGILAVKRYMGTTLAKKLKPDDTVYIFVATHGMVEKEAARAAYLLTHDSDREDLFTTALAMKDLGEIIQTRLKAKRIFVFADACRAGKLGGLQGNISNYIAEASKRTETMLLMASRGNEFSLEGPQFGGGHGAFTYFLLKGLMGEADSDKDKTVTAQELVDYVREGVRTATDKKQNIREGGEFDPSTPMSFTDKTGPADMKLASAPSIFPTLGQLASLSPTLGQLAPLFPTLGQLASMAFFQAPGADIRASFDRAIRETRLVAPAAENAWELYQRYLQQPVAQEQKDTMQEELIVALGTAGDRILADYRRGDQVVRLDAAAYGRGAQLFSRASQLDPSERSYQAKAKFMLGRAMVASRRYPEAIAALREAASLDPEAAYTYNALGIAHMEQGQFNDAITNFNSALQRAENWIYPRFNLGFVYSQLNRFRDAEQEYKKGIDLGQQLGRKYAYLHLNLGVLYLQQNRSRDAEEQFKRAIEMKPDDAGSLYNMGLVFQQRNNLGQAESYFQKAAALDATMAAPRLVLADMYRQRGRRDMEEKYLREAVAGDPRNATALEALGSALVSTKKLDEAERVFTDLMLLDPGSAHAVSLLGDVHAEQKNYAQAAEDYRQALAHARDEKLKRDLQRKLSSVEKKK